MGLIELRDIVHALVLKQRINDRGLAGCLQVAMTSLGGEIEMDQVEKDTERGYRISEVDGYLNRHGLAVWDIRHINEMSTRELDDYLRHPIEGVHAVGYGEEYGTPKGFLVVIFPFDSREAHVFSIVRRDNLLRGWRKKLKRDKAQMIVDIKIGAVEMTSEGITRMIESLEADGYKAVIAKISPRKAKRRR